MNQAPSVRSMPGGEERRRGNRIRNKPWPTGPHLTNQTHRYCAQNATARAQWHGSELWSPVRDEERQAQVLSPRPVSPQVTGPRLNWRGPSLPAVQVESTDVVCEGVTPDPRAQGSLATAAVVLGLDPDEQRTAVLD